jgi:hypothetical protein
LDQSLGEVLAAFMYDLELVTSDSKVSVARSTEGGTVQLKVTRSQKGTVGLYDRLESLLALQLSGQNLVELYNGPVALAWNNAGKDQGNR